MGLRSEKITPNVTFELKFCFYEHFLTYKIEGVFCVFKFLIITSNFFGFTFLYDIWLKHQQ